MIPARLSEVLVTIGTIDPGTVANTQALSDVIDMANYEQVMCTLLLGNMASETIDFRVHTCDAAGNNLVQLKAITQLAANASANDNAQAVITVRAEELNSVSEGARYIRFGAVTGGATGGPVAALVQGLLKSGRAATQDLASVLAKVN
jgi:hypothetical protein